MATTTIPMAINAKLGVGGEAWGYTGEVNDSRSMPLFEEAQQPHPLQDPDIDPDWSREQIDRYMALKSKRKKCAIQGCTPKSMPIARSYHQLPVRDQEIFLKWVQAIQWARNDPEWTPTAETPLVCSRHFPESDFILFNGSTTRSRLNNNAVPCLFVDPPDGTVVNESFYRNDRKMPKLEDYLTLKMCAAANKSSPSAPVLSRPKDCREGEGDSSKAMPTLIPVQQKKRKTMSPISLLQLDELAMPEIRDFREESGRIDPSLFLELQQGQPMITHSKKKMRIQDSINLPAGTEILEIGPPAAFSRPPTLSPMVVKPKPIPKMYKIMQSAAKYEEQQNFPRIRELSSLMEPEDVVELEQVKRVQSHRPIQHQQQQQQRQPFPIINRRVSTPTQNQRHPMSILKKSNDGRGLKQTNGTTPPLSKFWGQQQQHQNSSLKFIKGADGMASRPRGRESSGNTSEDDRELTADEIRRYKIGLSKCKEIVETINSHVKATEIMLAEKLQIPLKVVQGVWQMRDSIVSPPSSP